MKYENPFQPELISERQIALSKKWQQRKLARAELKKHGVTFDQRDVDEFYRKKSQFENMMKRSEEGAVAELMFAEGIDEEMAGRDAQRWLGELVLAYPSSEIDDVLRGSDTILMIPDEEDERKAYPVSVDLKTNESDYAARLATQLDFTVKKGSPDRVYWADLSVEPGGSSFDDPAEGRIDALPLTVLIPSGIVKEFRSNKTTNAQAKQIMNGLGPFVRRQMQIQLEALITLLAYRSRSSGKERGPMKISLSRNEIEQLIEHPRPMSSDGERRLFEIASHALQRVWDVQDSAVDSSRYGTDEQLPASVREMAGTS